MWFSFQYSLTETRRDSRCARGKNGGGGGGGYACWMNDCVVTTSRHCRSTVAAWHGSSCATLSSLSPKTPTERCGRREVSSRKPSDVGLSPFLSHFSDTCLFLAVFGRIHCVPHSADFHVDGDRHQAVGRRTPFLAGGRPRSLPVKFFSVDTPPLAVYISIRTHQAGKPCVVRVSSAETFRPRLLYRLSTSANPQGLSVFYSPSHCRSRQNV